MPSDDYKPRIIDRILQDHLQVFGAVCIEGPKWCGKTKTAENCCRSKFMVGDPKKNFQNSTLASLDPAMVLPGDTPRLIDEWQKM